MDENSNLSLRQAADLLGVHVDTVRRWADTGKLASWRTPGGWRRFDRADVEALRAGPAPELAAS